ncbi:hypothetical protein VYU27_007808 [Nannochloropsis oceanica]
MFASKASLLLQTGPRPSFVLQRVPTLAHNPTCAWTGLKRRLTSSSSGSTSSPLPDLPPSFPLLPSSSLAAAVSVSTPSFLGRATRELARWRRHFGNSARRTYTSYHRGGGRPPFRLPEGNAIVYGLIGANILVFGAWTYASQSRRLTRFMVEHFTVSAVGVLEQGRFHTLFTAMFSHQSFTHLLVNCVTLYFFGAEAAVLLGARRFVNLYFAGGLASSLGCVLWPFVAPKLHIPASYRVSKHTVALGASGAVNALVAWSIFMFPTRMVYLYLVLPVPAALLGVLFLAKDLSGLYQGGSGEANAGHLGGAVVGAAYYFVTRGRY